MSSLNYREWDIFINEQVKAAGKICSGFYACYVPLFAMATQTIGLLTEGFEFHTTGPVRLSGESFERVQTQTGSLIPIKVFGQYDPTKNTKEQIDAISDYLNALATCIDFPLPLLQVQFIDAHQGIVMHAARKAFGRGIGLEIDERTAISEKICTDFHKIRTYLGSDSSPEKVAIRHYLTGMTLLSLEDQAPGLIDAAYMQFYQGIEAQLKTHELKKAKIAIAQQKNIDTRTTQIICHQVFSVRHKYFGHADEFNFHEISDSGALDAFRLAKQCLVARWLCRLLIDQATDSQNLLKREMRFYGAGRSDVFFGTLQEVESNFWIDFGQMTDTKKEECDIYNAAGVVNDAYAFSLSPN